MFASIDLKGLKKSKLFGYAADVPFFKDKKTVEFKPGLNILFGPNGCGKSTVLNILGLTMGATQGGLSCVTEDLVHKTIDMLGALRNPRTGAKKEMSDQIGLAVAHDGQPVLFCDPRQTVGLSGGAFDNDFFETGMTEALDRNRLSHGQRSLSRANAALGILAGKLVFPKNVVHRVQKAHVNETWEKALTVLEARMAATLPKGQPTILLDEPESNLSLLTQANLWGLLAHPDVAANYQVIVASHSPFALGISHANYISFSDGYVDKTLACLRDRFGHNR